jgi:D-glycero-alpha-D-manno-heptose-7-phosphate kinase
MVITRTPFRISFFGGGTDYPGWSRQHGGAVLATTIDKYCYISCRYLPPFFDKKYRVVYSQIENCSSINEIKHPAVREGLRYLSINRGVAIHHDGDLPARSGMGSSSSFMVGLLHGLYALKGHMPTKDQLAKKSILIEQEILCENVGSQDQVSAAYGGLNHIIFQPNGNISVHPLTITQKKIAELNSHLMLFYTGIKRTASEIASSYVDNLDGKKAYFQTMKDLVKEGISVLSDSRPINDFGKLLHEAWKAKKCLSPLVSNFEVEQIYAQAVSAGALGGKLLGAGGGGFILFFAEPSVQVAVKDALSTFIHVPFEFEHSGSQVIFYSHEQDYLNEEKIRSQQVIKAFKELEKI